MATVDYFLKIDGIEGESVDAKHKGELELESFSWGLANSGTVGSPSGGAGAGKAQFDDLTFVALTSKASPKLFVACASGQHVKEAVLTARKAGEKQQEFLKVTLKEVFVTSYQTGGSADGLPADQVGLAYGEILVEYTPQKPDGSTDTPVTGGWNVVENKKA